MRHVPAVSVSRSLLLGAVLSLLTVALVAPPAFAATDIKVTNMVTGSNYCAFTSAYVNWPSVSLGVAGNVEFYGTTNQLYNSGCPDHYPAPASTARVRDIYWSKPVPHPVMCAANPFYSLNSAGAWYVDQPTNAVGSVTPCFTTNPAVAAIQTDAGVW